MSGPPSGGVRLTTLLHACRRQVSSGLAHAQACRVRPHVRELFTADTEGGILRHAANTLSVGTPPLQLISVFTQRFSSAQ